MPTRPNEFKAYFTLVGDFDPAEITVAAGLEPSESWMKEDRNEKTHFERKFSRWSIHSRLDQELPIVDHIRDVFRQLSPQKEELRSLLKKYEGGMQTVAYFHSDSPWFHFDEDVIVGCAALNLSLDCDFYTLYSDRREDSD